MPTADARRHLPSVDRVVEAMADISLPRALLADVARNSIDAARARSSDEPGAEVPDHLAIIDSARADARALASSLLQRVVNATGVLLHTNLGRAPLDVGSVSVGFEIATGYSNLEYRMDTGTRGSRHEHAGSLLARACGAEAGIVVNNNAAAVLVMLAALARGREVVISRGELVEIGGGFRIPDVMSESGARMVEVGTTNRTRVSDYRAAVGPDTALLLKVHTSNYRIEGFAEATAVGALAALGPAVAYDVGSGLLDATTPWLEAPPGWLAEEPGVRQVLSEGADLVTFSGDKLLGGPQGGVIVGRRPLVDEIARHPLARAVRADKLTLAAFQAVALAYLSGQADALPLWRMASTPVTVLEDRARRLAEPLEGVEPVATEAVIGGGSIPGTGMPSFGVAARAPGRRADEVQAALRRGGVVARIDDDAVLCDLRTVDPTEDGFLAAALKDALAQGSA